MNVSLEGCTTPEQVIERVTTLIDRAQADAERRLLTSLLLRDEDPAVIDQAIEAGAEWNREHRDEVLADLRDWLHRAKMRQRRC